jgi:putative tryptophan/tyrosine transport system substrate-binding protein
MSLLSRRQFVAGAGAAGLGVLAGCRALGSPVPQPVRVRRLGFLAIGAPPSGPNPRLDGLRQGLAEGGYVEGQNLLIDYRWAEGQLERLPVLAAELAALPVDVILAAGSLSARAARDATSTIPIVMGAEGDPVRLGLVASFAHPGGNLTGFSNMATELSGKRLQLLREVAPSSARVAVLWNSTSPSMAARVQEIQAAAETLQVTLHPYGVEHPEDFETAFDTARRERMDALMVTADPLTGRNRRRILDFAAAARLPAIYEEREWVVDGGLMAYGPSLPDQFRRAGGYVVKIFEGTKPADLPIDQAMTFDFVVNMKTARELGITFPEEFRFQITEAIE